MARPRGFHGNESPVTPRERNPPSRRVMRASITLLQQVRITNQLNTHTQEIVIAASGWESYKTNNTQSFIINTRVQFSDFKVLKWWTGD